MPERVGLHKVMMNLFFRVFSFSRIVCFTWGYRLRSGQNINDSSGIYIRQALTKRDALTHSHIPSLSCTKFHWEFVVRCAYFHQLNACVWLLIAQFALCVHNCLWRYHFYCFGAAFDCMFGTCQMPKHMNDGNSLSFNEINEEEDKENKTVTQTQLCGITNSGRNLWWNFKNWIYILLFWI